MPEISKTEPRVPARIGFMRWMLCALAICSPLLAEGLAKAEDFRWLAGQWSGNVGGAKADEQWMAPAGGALLGAGRVVAGGKMVQFEFLRIEQRGSDIYYVAQPYGRPPVDFKLTRYEPNLAVFENPAHDHPKIITYKVTADGTLEATIEGEPRGKKAKSTFTMKRVSQ